MTPDFVYSTIVLIALVLPLFVKVVFGYLFVIPAIVVAVLMIECLNRWHDKQRK